MAGIGTGEGEKKSFMKMEDDPGSMATRGAGKSFQRGRSTLSATSEKPKKKGWEKVTAACKRCEFNTWDD